MIRLNLTLPYTFFISNEKMTVTLNGIKQHRKINSIILYDNPFSLFSFFFSFFWLLFWVNNNKHIHDKNFIIFVNHWSCIDHGNHYRHLRYYRGEKVRPNPFVHPNLPILIELKPIQLLIGLNGHQSNKT